MAVNVGTAIAYLNLDATNFNTGLANAQSALANLNNGTGSLSQVMGAAGTVMANTGTALTRSVTLPLISAGKEIITFSADFEKQMSAVEAVMKSVLKPGDMDRLREAAISWGEQTVYTATEAAEALYYMGLAGWDVDQALGGLGAVLNLAAAGNVDLGRASDIVTDSMTAMNLQAGKTTNGIENTAYYTSVLAAVMANANTDVDKMGESFKYVAPIAGQLGFNIEDLGLALGLAANAGIKSSQAGTSLRQALKQLISPTDKTAAAMEKYGISLFDAQGKALPFRQIMLQLQETFGDLSVEVLDANGDIKEGEEVWNEYANSLPLSQQEKLKAVVDLFGTRAMPTMLAIIQQAGTEFYKLADAIDEAAKTGTYASEMAETQMDNLQGDWTRFTSALGTTKIMLEEIVDGWLRKFVQALTELVKKFNALDSAQKEQIIKWGLIAAAIGPVLTIVGRLMTTFATLVSMFATIGSSISSLGSVFGGLGGAITSASGGGTTLIRTLANIGSKANWIIAIIVAVISAIIDLWKNSESFRGWVKDAFQALIRAVKVLWEFIKKLLVIINDLWNSIVKVIEPLVAVLVRELAPSLEAFMSIVEAHIEMLLPLLQMIVNAIKVILAILQPIITVVAAIVGAISRAVTTIMTIVGNLMDGIKSIVGPALEWLSNLFGGWVEAIVNFFSDLKYQLIGDPIVIDLIEGIKSIFQAGLEFVRTVVEWFVNAVVSFFSWLKEKASEIISNMIEAIKSLWQTFKEWVSNAWSEFTSAISNALQTVRDKIVEGFEKFRTTMEQLLQSIFEYGKKIVNAIQQAAIDAWNNIVRGFNRAKEAIVEGIKIILQKLVELRDSVRQKFEELAQTVREKLTQLISNIRNKFDELKENIKQKFEEIKENIQQKIEDIKEKFLYLGNLIREKFSEIVQNIKEHFANIFEKIKEFGLKFVEAWKNAFKNVANGISSVFTTIKNGFVKFGTYVFGVAKNVGNAFIKGLLGTGQSIKEFFTNFIKEAILGLLSKIQAFKETGVQIITALWEGIKSAWSNLVNWLKEAWDNLVSGKLFKTIGEKISTWFQFGVNGSHADGLAYVPYNGYIAELHKGERVLTAEENQKYSNGNAGIGDGTTINFFSNEKIDEYTAARELRRTIKDIELGLV